jgi:hypothetical protein
MNNIKPLIGFRELDRYSLDEYLAEIYIWINRDTKGFCKTIGSCFWHNYAHHHQELTELDLQFKDKLLSPTENEDDKLNIISDFVIYLIQLQKDSDKAFDLVQYWLSEKEFLFNQYKSSIKEDGLLAQKRELKVNEPTIEKIMPPSQKKEQTAKQKLNDLVQVVDVYSKNKKENKYK